ncbi:MAG: hypothetical protein WD826_12090, partial [Actinomycetota bacterium]
MEPPPLTALVWRGSVTCGFRRAAGAPRQSIDLISIGAAQTRSVLTAAGLAAAAVGLIGTDAGVLWVVAGVWTVRSVAGAELNVAWGIAVIGAAMRWGTLSLADVAVATHLVGPSMSAGPVLVRAGLITALGAAVVGEWRAARWETRNWGERLAAAAA